MLTRNTSHIIIFAFLCESALAFYCRTPNAPSPPSALFKPTKPVTPYCVNELMSTHTCDSWEIDSYKTALRNYQNEVNDYIDELNDYIDEANDFVSNAVAYAKCEVNNLD
mgnify:CR=1 FL=1